MQLVRNQLDGTEPGEQLVCSMYIWLLAKKTPFFGNLSPTDERDIIVALGMLAERAFLQSTCRQM